ncbi:MAG: HU family DNA-binding protein [Patescibacteria group bacterium]
MNKAELSDKIAQRVGLSKKQAEDVLDAFEALTIETLKANGEVTLTGFGTFMAKRREARGGVNPQNPTERIQIPAVTVPKFKAGKTLKDAIKQSSPAPSQPEPQA